MAPAFSFTFGRAERQAMSFKSEDYGRGQNETQTKFGAGLATARRQSPARSFALSDL
jgi:hypothetical protein